jgi:hypothetical protein
MQTVTIPQIVERLQQLSDERLLVVYDFVSYLADRAGEQAGIEGPQKPGRPWSLRKQYCGVTGTAPKRIAHGQICKR